MQTTTNSTSCFNQHFSLRVGAKRTISSEVVASIRLVTRLEDVIAERVPLRRSGRAFVGSCPWHKSRSGRSFVVYPDQQTWRCWGCAVGGDVFGFFMRWGDVVPLGCAVGGEDRGRQGSTVTISPKVSTKRSARGRNSPSLNNRSTKSSTPSAGALHAS